MSLENRQQPLQLTFGSMCSYSIIRRVVDSCVGKGNSVLYKLSDHLASSVKKLSESVCLYRLTINVGVGASLFLNEP